MMSSSSAWNIDRASNWHFASLAHLAASVDAAAPLACQASQVVADLPHAGCPPDQSRYCHGIEGGSPPPGQTSVESEDVCLKADQQACRCTDHPQCRYPTVIDLQIDPRNGWAYAATNVGLLVSPDGGRTWTRTGLTSNEPQPALQPKSNYAVPQQDAAEAFAVLLTGVEPNLPQDSAAPESAGEWSQVPKCNGQSVTDVGEFGYDLQKIPWRIVRIGRMSMIFKPTTGSWPGGRPKGTLDFYVPVTWQVKEAGVFRERSSVFVAHLAADAEPRQHLVFRDVNSTLQYISTASMCSNQIQLDRSTGMSQPQGPSQPRRAGDQG